AENRLRRRVPLRVRDVSIVEADFRGGIATVVAAAAVKGAHLSLRKHPDELVAAELSERRIAERIGAPVAVLIGDDQVEIPAVPQRAIACQAVDRDQVVRLHAQPIAVELFDGNILYSWWIESFEQPAPPSDA